ncbi:hypothetical protein Pfo_010169 [Paulownia fortunei]|nr:hypothetical protein Pfo_010169 [Paulownia fortunei]
MFERELKESGLDATEAWPPMKRMLKVLSNFIYSSVKRDIMVWFTDGNSNNEGKIVFLVQIYCKIQRKWNLSHVCNSEVNILIFLVCCMVLDIHLQTINLKNALT